MKDIFSCEAPPGAPHTSYTHSPAHTQIHTHRGTSSYTPIDTYLQNTHTSTTKHHKHSHTYATQRHILIISYIYRQAYTHKLTHTPTFIEHTCIHTYMCLYSFLLTKDEEPSPLDSRGLECPGWGGVGRKHGNPQETYFQFPDPN